MIYCVIPQALEQELLHKLTGYYAEDDNVTVIVDRRRAERRASEDSAQDEQRQTRDRRRSRVAGDFPPLDPS